MNVGLRIACAVALAPNAPAGELAQWPHWGGLNRDFTTTLPVKGSESEVTGWSRPLGSGTSAVVASAGRVFATYGTADEGHVVAMDAATGQTIWARRFAVEYRTSSARYAGPHSTPAIHRDILVTVADDATVRAYRCRDGTRIWRRDLVREFDAVIPQSGYAASPLIVGDKVLLPGQGAPGFGAVALSLTNGATVWARHGFASSHASPTAIEFAGRTQAVFHGTNRLFGIDPDSGDVLWRFRLRTDAIDNVSFTPLWVAEESLLIVSHAYDRRGTQAVRLVEENGSVRAELAWSNRRLKVSHGNAVVLDGRLIASDGDESAYVVGIDATSGELLFKERDTPKATFLGCDGGRLIILDEAGVLHLARPTDRTVGISASIETLTSPAWTAPSADGGSLLLRDRKNLKRVAVPWLK